jgi:hypothetical protein
VWCDTGIFGRMFKRIIGPDKYTKKQSSAYYLLMVEAIPKTQNLLLVVGMGALAVTLSN